MDKAEMKRAYKEAKRPMGVFGVRDTGTKVIFLDHAKDITAKINRHHAELKFGTHRNKQLQALAKELGPDALRFEALDLLDHDDESRADVGEELKLLAEMWTRKLEEAGETVVRL